MIAQLSKRAPWLFLVLLVLWICNGPGASAQFSQAIDRLAAKIPVLQQAKAVPPQAALPRENKEIGELSTPRALLKESLELRKLLGDQPAFVYDPANRPDPMLVPWTRSRVMFGELQVIAEQAVAQKNWGMAEVAYRQMLALQGDSYRAMAEEGLRKMEEQMALEEGGRVGADGRPREAKLPPWIAANTSAVIIDKAEPVCLVGSFILKVGDVVPRQPVEVTIAKIEPNAVHYRVLDKIFVVNIKEGE
jgi:hypothetical protein